MKEYLYFSFADLMSEVEYDIDENRLSYCTHRKISTIEHAAIDRYLLGEYAITKTKFYAYMPAIFVYRGTDKKLVKIYDLFKCGIYERRDADKAVSEFLKSIKGISLEQRKN